MKTEQGGGYLNMALTIVKGEEEETISITLLWKDLNAPDWGILTSLQNETTQKWESVKATEQLREGQVKERWHLLILTEYNLNYKCKYHYNWANNNSLDH